MRRGQVYPESRVLWRHCAPLPDLMKLAACSLAKRLGLPSPASVDSLLDAAEWRTAVPDKGHNSGDDAVYSDSDSDSDSEE